MRSLGWLLIVAVFLAACAERKPPIVIDRTLSGAATHTVVAGDTLYSIALRYDRDYRELALINGLGADYLIKPGQRLRLNGKPAVAKPIEPASKPPVKVAVVEKPATPSAAKPIEAKPANKPVVASKPSPAATPAKPVVAVTPKEVPQEVKTASAVVSNTTPSAPASAVSATGWQWPAKGNVISKFGTQGLSGKGLDIAGQQGDAVWAAASGTVVYAGSGLVGYGKLLILRHDDNYISAYAHNDRFLVAEGNSVKAGQQIAVMGASGTDRNKLHFEIREKGKPVDPLKFLPVR